MTYGDLQKFIEDHGIENFGAREIAPRALPPLEYWANIIPTLQVAERLRAHEEVSYIIVTSGYRDPEHNRRVGGATASKHVLFNALDIVPMAKATFPVSTAWIRKTLEKHEPLYEQLGLGIYPTFAHIDTRGLFRFDALGAKF